MAKTKSQKKIEKEIELRNGSTNEIEKFKIKELIKIFPRRIALISDTHIASQYALMPEVVIDAKGNRFEANPGQKQILNYFKSFCAKCDELEVDTSVHLGDMIHGQNHREMGLDLITTDLNVQKDMAFELLKLICKGRRTFFIAGSGYHQGMGKANSPEKDVCDRLGSLSGYKTEWLGSVANIRFKPSKKIWHLQHGESASIVYRAGVLERDSNFLKIAEADNNLPHIDIVARGHWHTFLHLHSDRIHFIQTPCWATWTPWKWARLFYGKQPTIGGIICLLDEEGRLTAWPFIYKPIPRIADCVIAR